MMRKETNEKLCLILYQPPHYRSAIYSMIEERINSFWYFMTYKTDIKIMDLSVFNDKGFCRLKKRFRILYCGGFTALLRKYNTFLITGDVYNLSLWIFLIRAKLLFRHKHIYLWSHGWYGKESMVEKWIKKIFYSLSSGVFLYGNYAKDLMVSAGINSKKLFVIHNSLNYETHLKIRNSLKSSRVFKNHFNNDFKNLIFIGRLTKVKRLDLLLQSLKILISKGENFNLTLIGDGSEQENLQKLVKDLDIEKYVWFYGSCYDEFENSELIYNADLCVSPGNVGLTAIHCLSFGTPVITHNNFKNQMPEFEAIKQGITGDFFKQNDVSSIANCIESWFEISKDRQHIRIKCYEEIKENWNPKHQISVLENNIKYS